MRDGDRFVSGDLTWHGPHLSDLSSADLLARNLHSDRHVHRLRNRLVVNDLPGLIPNLLPSHRYLISVLLVENSLLINDLLNDSLSRRGRLLNRRHAGRRLSAVALRRDNAVDGHRNILCDLANADSVFKSLHINSDRRHDVSCHGLETRLRPLLQAGLLSHHRHSLVDVNGLRNLLVNRDRLRSLLVANLLFLDGPFFHDRFRDGHRLVDDLLPKPGRGRSKGWSDGTCGRRSTRCIWCANLRTGVVCCSWSAGR